MTLDFQSHEVFFSYPDSQATRLWSTYQENTWLEESLESPPAVKTSFVEVPASDGVVDLTDAVAGRPLYGQRQLDIAVNFVGADHESAAQWAQTLRGAIHGKRLCVSTPDSRSLVTNGCYIGRVAVSHTITLNHAHADIHVDCDPWVYYGKVRVTLPAGSTTEIAWGDVIPAALRSDYTGARLTLTRPYTGYSRWYSEAFREITLVESSSENIVQMPEQLAYARYDVAQADYDTETWAYQQVANDGDTLSFLTNKNQATRVFAAAHRNRTAFEAEDFASIGVTNAMYVGIKVTGTCGNVSDDPSPLIRIVHAAGRVSSSGYGVGSPLIEAKGGKPRDANARYKYTDVTINADGTFEAYAVCNFQDVWGGTSAVWLYAGVETQNCTAAVQIKTFFGWTNGDYVEPSNTARVLSLPTGMYASSTHKDYVVLSREVCSLYTHFAESGTTATEQNNATQYQVARMLPSGTPARVNAYGSDNFAQHLQTSVIFTSEQTVTVDAGTMPTTMSIETTSPMQVKLDGKTYQIASSGFAPFAFSGIKTMQYTIYGTQLAYIEYEKGII